MADTPVNVLTPMRFEANGIFRITDGATDYAVRNIEKGSLRIKFAGQEPLEWQERGANKVPLEGDQQTGEIELEVKVSKKEATGLYEILRKRNSPADGLVKAYTVRVDIPYYASSATGHRYEFNEAYVMPDSLEQAAGERFDTLRFRMRFTSMDEPTTF